jgi:CelD/BcsL family acetyltransferase involved in cellulose biosynthesis
MVQMTATIPVKHAPDQFDGEPQGVVTASCCVEPAAADIDIELITGRAAFDALEAEWNALFERAGRSAQVFQSFNWNWHWANNYLDDAPGGIRGLMLSVVAGRKDGKLVMIWPLVSERVRGITQIFWMGEPVSQYGDVLVDNIPDALECLRAGWQFLKSRARGDVVRLRRVRADAVIAPLLEEIGALASNKQVAPFLDLSSAPDFAAYEQRYSSRSRRNRRRLARRLEEAGDVTFERHKGGAKAAELAVQALDLKALWLQDRGLVSHAIADPRMRCFFRDAVTDSTRSTNSVVSALICNGDPAALEVSFTCKGRLAMHVIVFNLAYEKSGAGVLLLEQSIRDGYTDRLSSYDMLAPGDNYKLDWSDATVEVQDWSRPLTLAGQTYARLYLGLVRPHMKAVIEAMPQALRRIVSTGRAHAMMAG